jgi:flagellar hook-length control protein FliK
MSRLLAATPVASVDPVAPLLRFQSDGDDAPARLVPGARVFMQVIEPLIEGGVRARVVNGNAEHRLPFDAKAGARLHVLIAGTEAQPTFLLLKGDEGIVDASLSRAARVLAALTTTAAQPTRPPVVTASAPLLPGPGIDAPALSRALADALARSGLFYEAHQAQWISGARDREALLNEPQARLTLRDVAGETRISRADADMATRGSDARAPGQELNGIVHRDTVPLVQQQLAALETGALVWRGEAWRGQKLEWKIQRDSGRQESNDGENSHGQWRTRVRLTMPQLGGIDASLAIDGRGLDVRIVAADVDAANTLRSAAPLLAATLGEAGLMVRRLEVQHGP